MSTVFPWGVFEVGVLAEKGSLKMGNGVFRLPLGWLFIGFFAVAVAARCVICFFGWFYA